MEKPLFFFFSHPMATKTQIGINIAAVISHTSPLPPFAAAGAPTGLTGLPVGVRLGCEGVPAISEEVDSNGVADDFGDGDEDGTSVCVCVCVCEKVTVAVREYDAEREYDEESECDADRVSVTVPELTSFRRANRRMAHSPAEPQAGHPSATGAWQQRPPAHRPPAHRASCVHSAPAASAAKGCSCGALPRASTHAPPSNVWPVAHNTQAPDESQATQGSAHLVSSPAQLLSSNTRAHNMCILIIKFFHGLAQRMRGLRVNVKKCSSCYVVGVLPLHASVAPRGLDSTQSQLDALKLNSAAKEHAHPWECHQWGR